MSITNGYYSLEKAKELLSYSKVEELERRYDKSEELINTPPNLSFAIGTLATVGVLIGSLNKKAGLTSIGVGITLLTWFNHHQDTKMRELALESEQNLKREKLQAFLQEIANSILRRLDINEAFVIAEEHQFHVITRLSSLNTVKIDFNESLENKITQILGSKSALDIETLKNRINQGVVITIKI